MLIKQLHKWNLSYARAVELQRGLACEVRFTRLPKRPGLVAGLDCAFSRDGQRIIACVVVLKMLRRHFSAGKTEIEFEIIETKNAVRNVTFPYIPGLLSFREAPVCLAAVKKLKNEPDAFIIDGQGIAHPRRLGLAAHLGLFFDKPTIGCAKSRLTGTFEDPPPEKGAYTFLRDKSPSGCRAKYETIGAVVRTRTNVKPVFVSIGNRCRLEDAIELTLTCATRYRLPEPTRLAHQLVSKLKLNT